MTHEPHTPDEQQLYALMRLYDEALAHGARPGSLDDGWSGLHHQLADEFGGLRDCVELLEQMRRARDAREVSPLEVTGATTDKLDRPLPLRLGRFEPVDEIGRGACGIVFRAHDSQVGRDVALKVPRPETLLVDELRERFLQEARAAGNLDHPNIVPIYEVGEDGPICFIAAAYIEGPSLATWLGAGQEAVDVRQAAALVAALADAVEHAHRRGVIHRDIKPANILLQPLQPSADSPDLSGYAPKLTDFGLAKLLEANDSATRTGMILGTPAYMAPEQAEGCLEQIGPGTDVYALGAVLYELLAGRPPLRGESEFDTLRRIASDDPPPIRLARPGIPRDLEAVCLKCLEKRSAGRYSAAAELSADLRRFLGGETTRARPIGPALHTARWLRRRPTIAALLLVSLVSLALLVTGSLFYSARIAQALSTAEAARKRAEDESRASRQLLYSAEVRSAYDAWNARNRARAIELLERQRPTIGQPDLREFAWYYLWGASHAELRTLSGHTDDIFNVEFSPDGSTLATASKDGTARLWDVATGKMRQIFAGHSSEVTCVAFSPDGEYLATGSEDRQVLIWDTASGAQLFALRGHTEHVLALAFSPDGRILASGGRGNCVRLWDLDSRSLVRTLEEPAACVRSLRFSGDGRQLAASDEAGVVHRWDTSAWRPAASLSQTAGPLFAVGFDLDAPTKVFAAGRDRSLYFWDLHASRPADQLDLSVHESWIRDLEIAPCGTMLATAGQGGVVGLWDVSNLSSRDNDQPLAMIQGHDDRVYSVAWSPDGELLATAGADHVVKLWRAADMVRAYTFPRVRNWIWDLAFSDDTARLVTCSQGGQLLAWDVAAHRSDQSIQSMRTSAWMSLAITPDGTRAAVAAGNREIVQFLDLLTGELLFEAGGFSSGVNALDISPDGTLLAVGGEDNIAAILSLPSGRELYRLPHDTEVDDLAFSPDGETLVTCSRELRLWDVPTGSLRWGQRSYESDPDAALFSPDGRTIAAPVGETRVVFVDAENGESRSTITSDRGFSNALGFSPDGQTLAIGTRDSSTVTLWDVRTRQELCQLDSKLHVLLALEFSPDGRRLIAAGESWDAKASTERAGQLVEWELPTQSDLP